MQCLNTKIKEEEIAGDAYVGESSSIPLSHPSTAATATAQQKVILSPRIEIHRIVKNHHSGGVAATALVQNGNANNDDNAYERKSSPMTDDSTDAVGGGDRMQQLPPSLPSPHQFVSPPNNCAVLHYREHRTDTTSMALPQQRVHVIKDGRFYSTTTTTATSSPPSNGITSATTTSAASVAAAGPTATSKKRLNLHYLMVADSAKSNESMFRNVANLNLSRSRLRIYFGLRLEGDLLSISSSASHSIHDSTKFRNMQSLSFFVKLLHAT